MDTFIAGMVISAAVLCAICLGLLVYGARIEQVRQAELLRQAHRKGRF